MNNPNPFVPKGSLLEQQNQRRSRLKFWGIGVVGLSSAALVVMLIQGCHRENPDTQQSMDTNNTTPGLDLTNNTMASASNNFAAPITEPMAPSNMVATAPMPPPTPVPPVVPPTEPPPAAGTDYVIKSGDTMGKIAKANGVSLKALLNANPGVDPKKLKPGKKITIPASTSSAGTAAAPMAGAAPMADATGGQSYVVKSGDTLSKISKKFSVSVKALRAANPKFASTDHIHVGDKLTIPVKATAAAAAPVQDASASAPMPPPASTPAPAPAPTTPSAPGH